MALNSELRQRLESTIGSDNVVLFMKGTRQQPQCGFSATVIGILDKLVPDYTTVNVLEHQDLREGIKELSSWPTVPQLYVGQEFLGGCDIIKQMFNSGDLHQMLGVEPPDRTPPEITISDEAAQVIRQAIEEQPGAFVHLTIDAAWNHQFGLGPSEGHEVRAQANGIAVLLDLDSAQRARGLRVDMTETLEGHGFSIENPNAPPPVKAISPPELRAKLDAGDALELFDVRDETERARAVINGSKLLDRDATKGIGTLPKDTPLVFYCHYGPRSQGAADHFRNQGYTNVYNLVGGIDAWSQQVDPEMPRY